MTDDDLPISYQAAVRGTPVLSSSGATIGTLEHVLEVPEVDVFDGIVIATDGGLRFIDADQVLPDHPEPDPVHRGRRPGQPVAAARRASGVPGGRTGRQRAQPA